ncbi:unnamed protein product, partial [Amoebophrya sp. A120]
RECRRGFCRRIGENHLQPVLGHAVCEVEQEDSPADLQRKVESGNAHEDRQDGAGQNGGVPHLPFLRCEVLRGQGLS